MFADVTLWHSENPLLLSEMSLWHSHEALRHNKVVPWDGEEVGEMLNVECLKLEIGKTGRWGRWWEGVGKCMPTGGLFKFEVSEG